MLKYFAYGSNMDQQRMISRGVIFSNMKSATLNDYELKFNKISKQGAVANIEPKVGSTVEGILYDIDSLIILDHYEGFPKHYNRILLTLNCGTEAYVYVENKEYIVENLNPKQEYLNHLLEGKNYLSEKYFEKLKTFLC